MRMMSSLHHVNSPALVMAWYLYADLLSCRLGLPLRRQLHSLDVVGWGESPFVKIMK